MQNTHVEPDLLAYLDGELDGAERARVEAHLARCPACAARLDELRVLRRDLDATLDAALSPVRLSYAADQKIREKLRARLDRPRWWQVMWPWRGVLAQAVMALLLVMFSFNAYRTFTLPAPAAPQETLVLGQDRLSPGSRAALRVIVRGAETALPMAGAEVMVTLSQGPNLLRRVYTGLTDARGTADVAFTVPEDWVGEAALIVETTSPAGTERIARPIVIERAYKIYLSPDKPAYRPGQIIHLRALALDAATFKPVTGGELTLSVINADGHEIARHARACSDYGVAVADVALADSAAPGVYTLRAALGDTVSERTVTVGDYELPPFRVTFETDRRFYAPGDAVQVTGDAAYFFESPVDGGLTVLRAFTDASGREPVVEIAGETGADGHFAFAFDLPAGLGRDSDALVSLEVEIVDDAGQRSGLRKMIPVSAQPLSIKAVPESGVLKPGVENVVYVMTAYPDGTPAEAELTVFVDDEGRSLRTGAYGLAELRFTPQAADVELTILAKDAMGLAGQATFPLEVEAMPQIVLLRAEKAAYEVGETLRLEALTSAADDTVYLDVVHAQQTAAVLSAPVEDGRATFALDLDASLVGALELHAYVLSPDGNIVEDTRLVVVDMPRQVAVDVTADQPRYRHGDTAHIQIQTAIVGPVGQAVSLPSPIQSALGIAVVDESVYALDTLSPGFARAYFLLEDALAGEDAPALTDGNVPALLDAAAETRAAQDVAARAAWAGASATGFSLRSRTVTSPPDATAASRRALVNRLGMALSVLPLLLGLVVARGLAPPGLLGRALRRLGVGLLILLVLSPLLIVGGVLGVLVPVFGAAALVGVLALVALLLVALFIHGWLRRDTRVQLVTGLLALYLVLGGMLVVLAARAAEPAGAWIAALVVTFLLMVGALALLGQGLALEGRRAVGWLTTALALLLVVLVVLLPALPTLASNLTRALGNPGLYAGPLAWMAGCSVPTPETIVGTEAVEKTVEVEKVVEESVEAEPTEVPAVATATAPVLPTATPQPEPTATPSLLVPAEPYPLRTLFPETLYWAPEALTDEDGEFAFDLSLPALSTTWRVTVLASTQAGDLGAATYPVVVSQHGEGH